MGAKMYKKVLACRICGNINLEPILDLGMQMLTGVFPNKVDPTAATTGPLVLVKCISKFDDVESCGLVQLQHSYDLKEMYGLKYGYRSGLNKSMVDHLRSKVERIKSLVTLYPKDLVIDIGSNDGTTLAAYPEIGLNLVGVDPTGVKFVEYYPKHIKLRPDFFSAKLIEGQFPGTKAKVVTSFSMFYDLEDPIAFMKYVHRILADDGIWVFEQSYLPTMIQTNSYDTVCHEHLEFYCVKQIQYMVEKVGFQIIDVEFNDINGGSFSVTVRKAPIGSTSLPQVQEILQSETDLGFDSLKPFTDFAIRTKEAKISLLAFLANAKKENKKVVALGASTKGNVLLQYCELTNKDIAYIGEVNEEKFNCYAPGTWIPIIPEKELLDLKPDYLIVLPWHFKSFFLNNPKFSNFSLVFPLPYLEVVH